MPEPISLFSPEPRRRIFHIFDLPLSPGWCQIELALPDWGVSDLFVAIKDTTGDTVLQQALCIGRNRFALAVRTHRILLGIEVYLEGSANAEALVVTVKPFPLLTRLLQRLRRFGSALRSSPREAAAFAIRHALRLSRRDEVVFFNPALASSGSTYQLWQERFDENPERDRGHHQARLKSMLALPTIGIIVIEQCDLDADRKIFDSLLGQILTPTEIIWIGKQPPEPTVVSVKKIHPLDSPARSLNTALNAASSEWLLVLPSNVVLRPHALLELALVAVHQPQARMIFADDDRIASDGTRSDPVFRTAWSPERAIVANLAEIPFMMRSSLLRELKGWRETLEPAHEQDLILRLSEAGPADGVVHLAKIVGHRVNKFIIKSNSYLKPAIISCLKRRYIDASIATDPISQNLRLVFTPTTSMSKVSLIIPTRDQAEILELCLRSILERTVYPSFEIIVIDNGSVEPKTTTLFERIQKDTRVRVLSAPGPFNYSALNNAAAKVATGDILGLINNDIEVLNPEWLSEMAGYAALPEIGCVGAKLLYPDKTLQHGGVIVGLSGGAGHAYKHLNAHNPGDSLDLVSVRNLSAVTAACLVIRKSVYEEVAGLNENAFKVAFNDVDLCLKVAASGYRNVWTPFAQLTHHESLSRGKEISPRKARRFAEEVQSLRQMWGWRLLQDPYYSPHRTRFTEDHRLRTN